MTYSRVLPNAFPYLLRTSRATVRYMVREIIDGNRPDVPQGSSFAITVDNWDGTWNLWMSKATKDFIVSKHPHTERTIIPAGHLLED